jgi:hypothetical protein
MENYMSFLFNNNVAIPALNQDAFGRLRTSEPYTLGDYKHLYGIDPNFINYTANGGAITFQANQAAARLSTTNNSASRAVHQSALYHHYMPGKSQLALFSFNFYAATTNVTKRTGYFDDNNGIFFEQTGDGTLNMVLRSYVSGTPVDTRIPQSSWNADKCDGTGASGFNLDITKTQLFFTDFQWLGVGKVRVGFAHQGTYIVAHTFNGTNNLATVYMSNPNLPVRCEIVNVGATTGAYFDQVCSTVVSEGGYVEAGTDWGITSPSLRTIASGATLPVLAIRLKTTFQSYANRMIVRMGNINVFSSGENIKWSLYKLPNQAALTGSTWVSVDASSGVEYNATATAVSTWDEMDNGFVASGGSGGNAFAGAPTASLPSVAKKNFIVQNYDSSDSQIYVIFATNIGSSSTSVGVGLQWREVY